MQGRIATIVLAVATLAACSDSSDNFVETPATAPASTFEEHPCEVDIPEGFSADDVRCGTLTAARDRDDPESETLTVEFGVVLARQPDALPDPFVWIPGGPGGQALGPFFAFDALGLLKQVNRTRDIVYFDPRGTGISTPDLFCPERLSRGNEALLQPGGGPEDGAARVAGMRECYDRLIAAGRNLSGFSSASIAADLVEGLRALGYEQANFWGTSYGGRVVQTVMRDYPEMVRSVILDAPYMPEVRTTWSSDFQRALDRLVRECAAAPGCNAANPDLESQFYAAVDRLNLTPAEVEVQFDGATQTIFVSGDRFMQGLANTFNNTALLQVIPAAISSVANGNFAIIQALAPDLLSSFDTVAWGHYASVECAENLPYWSEAQRMQSNANVNPVITAALDPVNYVVDVATCEFWAVEERPAIAAEAVISDLPTMILQGDYDVAIPVSNAEKAAQNLSNSQLVIFPGFGHVIIGSAFDADGTFCSQQLLAQFLADPFATLDTTCVDEIPPLFQ